MGRPYENELAGLSKTYDAAMVGSKELASAITRIADGSLIVIGSGGSLSAAACIAQLHEHHTGYQAKALTPLEFIEGEVRRDASVFCLTASGRNTDIRTAFECAARREPKHLLALCMTRGSPLSKLAAKYRWADFVEETTPAKKDGFLATNSLLAMSVHAATAYARLSPKGPSLPTDLPELLERTIGPDALRVLDSDDANRVFERSTISTIYSGSLRPAAIDLESRFVEAALGNLHTADLRNFAHGRHLWLAKRGSSTGVVALIERKSERLARQTFALIPASIPVLRFEFDGDVSAQSLAGLVVAMHIAGAMGKRLHIDPGRPGVPAFGRRIYHLRPISRRDPTKQNAPNEVAIFRKTRKTRRELAERGYLAFWETAYQSAIDNFRDHISDGIIFDYDGTLCDPRRRFEPLELDVAKELSRLVEADARIAVVTGRGQSVRSALHAALPSHYWSRVLIGYYNGAEIGFLSEEGIPKKGEPEPALREIMKALKLDRVLGLERVEARRYQISIAPDKTDQIEPLWDRTKELIERTSLGPLCVVRSSHSIDILAPGVSKSNILAAFQNSFEFKKVPNLVRIGDRGRWPGNDFSLLDDPFGLSVDECSFDPKRCWNFAPAGYRGVQATVYYLQGITPTKNGVRINLN